MSENKIDVEKKVFRARISVLLIVILGVFHIGIGYSISTHSDTFFNVGTYILIGSLVICFIAFRSFYYVLTEKEIQIYYLWGLQGKPYPHKIFISTIISVERSNTLVGTGSLKSIRFRLKKDHKWQHYLWTSTPSVSPVREKECLETLKSLNPNMQINITDKKGWLWRFLYWDI